MSIVVCPSTYYLRPTVVDETIDGICRNTKVVGKSDIFELLLIYGPYHMAVVQLNLKVSNVKPKKVRNLVYLHEMEQ